MLTDIEKSAISRHYKILSHNLPNFRPREAQRKMLAQIAHSFARAQSVEEKEKSSTPTPIAVIEGPTGVGKSLAYLLAGTILAQSRKRRLIVSSATIALQEQLVQRDLPFVAENSGLSITYALAKGRGRYLCPYRLYQITQNRYQNSLEGMDFKFLLDQPISDDEHHILNELSDAFAERRFDGDRDNYKEFISDELWSRINGNRYKCLKNTCPNRSECPFFLARETLENVDVIVVNHDLLLSDIVFGGGVILPDPKNCFYCIDEAHHLPKKAVERFSATHSLFEIRYFLQRLTPLCTIVESVLAPTDLLQKVMQSTQELLAAFAQWEIQLEQGDEYFTQSKSSPHSQSDARTWLWELGTVPECLVELVKHMHDCAHGFWKVCMQVETALADKMRDKENLPPSGARQIDQIGIDWAVVISHAETIDNLWNLMARTTDEHEPPIAKWIEQVADHNGDYIFHATPISAARMLANQLWSRAGAAVLTSATLRALGKFDLIMRHCGLNFVEGVETLALDSPFNYANQAQLYLPPLIHSPKNAQAHTEEIIQWLPQLIDLSHAEGTLVLFTSRHQMNEVAQRLPVEYRNALLVQGAITKSQLLMLHQERIQAQFASIIFGLDSFAEGLDLPGVLCVQVIIAKLPFAMPDHPIDKTRSAWISARGGNPFIELSVPEASVKLTQAVGRLIRTEQDYGRVCVLDNRLTQARYGHQLLSALPPFARV